MEFDVARHLGAVTRSVRALEIEGKPARAVILSRAYDTDVDDLWDAIVDPERLKRWFLPVTGDLRLGGRYQLQGNAGGRITGCEPPRFLAMTWEFSGQMSWVEVRLSDDAPGRARLTLEHLAQVSDFWTTYGPGAGGVGWELGLSSLDIYLLDPAMTLTEEELAKSPAYKTFVHRASADWGRAAIAGGEDPEISAKAAKATAAFYTGESPPA